MHASDNTIMNILVNCYISITSFKFGNLRCTDPQNNLFIMEIFIVTCRLKAEISKSERWSIVSQRLGSHVSVRVKAVNASLPR